MLWQNDLTECKSSMFINCSGQLIRPIVNSKLENSNKKYLYLQLLVKYLIQGHNFRLGVVGRRGAHHDLFLQPRNVQFTYYL